MRKLFFIMLVVLLASCRESDDSITLEAVYQNTFCSSQARVFMQLTDQQSMEAVVGAARMLGEKPELPQLDFANAYVLFISMGSRPSGGYRLVLNESQAVAYDNKLILPVVFKQPEEGMMQAAVMTSPCMIVSLSKGEYRRVVLQTDKALQSLSLKNPES